MGRAAWSRRPPLTRERKNQHLPPSRAGRVTFSRTIVVAARWSGGPAGIREGWHGPLTGARTGWGARSPSIPAAGVFRHHPAEKTPLRAAQRVGFSPSTAKMGLSARSGPIRSERGELPAGAGRGMPSRVACSVPSAR